MSNRRHDKCAIRNLAADAKKRLAVGNYSRQAIALEPPKTLTPEQKKIYIRLREFYERGEEIVNPIGQLADKKLMQSMSHEEKQRFIIRFSSDFLLAKHELLSRLAACDEEPSA